jgi:3-oxoacyl-[acyl-carrier protein] reductase
MMLQGRYAIITGASQGLGEAIAEKFVAEGASVMLCARGAEALEGVHTRLSAGLADGQLLCTQVADVASRQEVDALVAEALRRFPHVEILVNNAGVYGPFGHLDVLDWDKWVQAIEINLMGTVYPCRALIPHLKSRQSGKIINLSGGGATNPLPGISAYAASKAAVVRMTETMALELQSHGIDVNAVAPGALATRLTDQLLDAGPEKVGAAFHERMTKLKEEGGTPLTLGANLCAWLASTESDGITGKLLSAQWDPWASLQSHRDDLDGTDIYTLRRIVPKDRGKAWGGV